MTKTVFNLFESGIDLVNRLIYLCIGLALVGFLWGVLRFLFSGGNEKLKKDGKDFMVYGILVLFVMTSVWAIVYMVQSFVLDTPYQGDVNTDGWDELDNPSQDKPFTDPSQLFEKPDQYAV